MDLLVVLLIILMLIGLGLIFGISYGVYRLLKKRTNFYKIFSSVLLLITMPSLFILLCYQFNNYWTQPTKEDSKRLGEMTLKVMHSPSYEKISNREKVFAVVPSVYRFNRPKDSYIYEVNVKTDKQTYSYSCDDDNYDNKRHKCNNVHVSGWSYSEYSEDPPFYIDYKGYQNGKAVK
ncbi:hypothetical protein ACMGE7_02185 [Macrococcus equi]|uniref:hypothetical protein n=1 Tax=Macrococcus equi TaxID=3395462 RepID=UPI0039BDB073